MTPSWSTEIGAQSLHFGEGTLARLGEVCGTLGGQRVLVVTDPGIRAAGHVERAVASLQEAGCRVAVFDQVEENPTTLCVRGAAAAARALDADLLVGLGGGSAMDSAKGANFLVTNGGRMADYWGFGKAAKPLLPTVGVPTTAGTGSEAQSYALISQEETHRKMACGDAGARFRAVILDPELLRTAPREVTAVSGYDAISHAVESYVCRRRNPISVLYAAEAWRRLEGAYETILAHPEDSSARANMMLGAYLAGASIELSMLGAAHSCANPLTARFGVVHGNAVGLMLPAVVRFNGPVVDELYGQLLAASGPSSNSPSSNGQASNGHGHAGHLSRRLEALRQVGSRPQRLRDVGIHSADLAALAREAAEQWTAQFNPRQVSEKDLQGLYEEVL